MTRRILFATDLSARSDRPFERTMMLADLWHAEHYYIFVNADRSPVSTDKVVGQLKRSYGDDINKEQVIVLHGKVPEAICKTADNMGANLIVLGAARHNNLTDFFLGTAVDYIVRHTELPVLVVKEKPRHDYKHIMVAADFSKASANAVKQVIDLFPSARITVAHAYHAAYGAWLDPDSIAAAAKKSAERDMAAFIKGLQLPPEVTDHIEQTLIEGELHQSIYDAINDLEVDLLALGTHGRSGFVHATIGSRAAEMLGWAPSDVLMIRKQS